MEILSTMISEVGKCLYEPLKRHCGYLFCYTRNIDKLSEEVKTLCTKRDDLDRKLEEARRSQREPLQAVKDWKEKVETVVANQANIGRTDCCWCPNFISSRYRLGKDAAREIDRVKELSDDHNNLGPELTFYPPPPAVAFVRTDTIQTTESTTSVEERVIQALSEQNTRSIGIHGMPGIGKTTLVTKINNDMKDSNDLFDKVIMVTVSQNPDLKVIQGDIAERLGLHIKEFNAVDHRANLLAEELKKYDRILIILDDVWQKLEMVQLGIPRRDEHPCCKIIVTTRNSDVCDKMRMDKKVAVQPWSLDDSMKLFQSKLGFDILSKNPTLVPLANKIVEECGGCPLAIATLASALIGNQNEVFWKDALRCLKSSDPDELENIDGMNTVISSIRFSYNNLTAEGMKLCFLFCSLFPEDYEIDLSDLRTYGIGEGFLRVDGNLLEARGKLESYVERLKARNLLLGCDKKNKVKMHDVVRDVARLIASKEHGFIEKSRLGISEWPKLDNAKGYKHMSLIRNTIHLLPNSSNMPELRSLLMQENRTLKEIPDTFFEGLNLLVNLDLSRTALSRLPSSISCLTSLRTLQLSYYLRITREMDVPLLGKLKNLEILIIEAIILKDPNELAALTKLKVLHLDQTLESIPTGVLSKLLYLEELHLSLDPNKFFPYVGHEEVDDCSRCSEVASLKYLTTLSSRKKWENSSSRYSHMLE